MTTPNIPSAEAPTPGASGNFAQDTSDTQVSAEAHEAAVAALGSAFHEQWRETRRQEDGSFEPREKSTKDQAWIETHGTDTVDIANTAFGDLPEDWKAENAAAATTVVGILDRHNGAVDLTDDDTRNAVGEEVHAAWLSRNEWAKDGDLGKPFADLPKDEQDKDLAQVTTAIELFHGATE